MDIRRLTGIGLKIKKYFVGKYLLVYLLEIISNMKTITFNISVTVVADDYSIGLVNELASNNKNRLDLLINDKGLEIPSPVRIESVNLNDPSIFYSCNSPYGEIIDEEIKYTVTLTDGN